MNYFKSLFILLVFHFIFSGNAAAHVALDYPVGGEVFHQGDSVTIQWHNLIYHGTSDFDLYFSNDGGSTWQTIVENLPESQFDYNWTVPNITTNSGRIRVIQDNVSGSDYSATSADFNITISTGIEQSDNYVNSFKLFPAYPNPFNPTTTIEYSIPEDGIVKLTVFNVIGEKVKTIVNEFRNTGRFKVIFDGTSLTSGMYFYKLQTNNFSAIKRMILMK